jgi:response regulator RpfG family c-di-GMP phosphodiesterase
MRGGLDPRRCSMVMREQSRESEMPQAARPTVLVVDDDAETLSALRRALRSESCTVLTTDDPYMALAWVKSCEIGLVITDEFMPAMLGTELLEAVRESSPGTATILLTGYPKPDVMFRGFRQRVDLMLVKPWEDRALRESALGLLRDRDPRSGPSPV